MSKRTPDSKYLIDEHDNEVVIIERDTVRRKDKANAILSLLFMTLIVVCLASILLIHADTIQARNRYMSLIHRFDQIHKKAATKSAHFDEILIDAVKSNSSTSGDLLGEDSGLFSYDAETSNNSTGDGVPESPTNNSDLSYDSGRIKNAIDVVKLIHEKYIKGQDNRTNATTTTTTPESRRVGYLTYLDYSHEHGSGGDYTDERKVIETTTKATTATQFVKHKFVSQKERYAKLAELMLI